MSRWESFAVLNVVTVDVLKVGEGFKHQPLCIKKAINFRNRKGRENVCYGGWGCFVVLNVVTVDVLKVGEGFKHQTLCIKKAINFRKAWPSNCNRKGRENVCFGGWGAGVCTAQTWNVCGGRGYANVERIRIRLSKRTEHHRGERVPFLLHHHTNAFCLH